MQLPPHLLIFALVVAILMLLAFIWLMARIGGAI